MSIVQLIVAYADIDVQKPRQAGLAGPQRAERCIDVDAFHFTNGIANEVRCGISLLLQHVEGPFQFFIKCLKYGTWCGFLRGCRWDQEADAHQRPYDCDEPLHSCHLPLDRMPHSTHKKPRMTRITDRKSTRLNSSHQIIS